MIYGKLPVVFLSTIASEKNGSTNCVIATYILEHLDEMQDIGIKEIAKKCNVAVSSISRFCKEIGLRDFVELKELLSSIDFYFEEQSHSQSFPTQCRCRWQPVFRKGKTGVTVHIGLRIYGAVEDKIWYLRHF